MTQTDNHAPRSVDVLVAGGGPAGIAAAVAAARNGARTLLIERYGFLGGELATGLPMLTFHAHHNRQVVRGVAQELVDRLTAAGGSCGHVPAPQTHVYTWTPSYPEVMKYVAQELVLEAGADLLLHSFVTEALVEDNAVRGVVAEGKSGRRLIRAQRVVDATGDGDVAARAGAPFEKGRPEDGLMQPVSLIFSLGNVDVARAAQSIRPNRNAAELVRIGRERGHYIRVLGSFAPWQDEIEKINLFHDRNHGMAMFSLRDREVTLNTSKVLNVDATDTDDLTRAEIEARRQVVRITAFMKEHIPGFEDSYLSNTAPHIGVRESRRITGEYVLTREDVLEAREFPDSVACSSYTIDIHNPVGRQGLVTRISEKTRGYYGIPYRCLVPREIENLLVGGRCISCTHTALGSVRVIVICMATGEAAGTAAALSLTNGVSPRQLDVQHLRERLTEQGAVVA